MPFLLFFLSSQLLAQSGNNPLIWMNFDQDTCEIRNEVVVPSMSLIGVGDYECGCGAIGEAINFGGSDNDLVLVAGEPVDNAFSTADFTLSFYFKPLSTNSENLVLFSKRDGCDLDSSFAVKYNPGNQVMTVELNEVPGLNGTLTSKPLPPSCWYHAAVVRKGGTTLLYINGKEQGKFNAQNSHRINIFNKEELRIGSSDCPNEKPFVGYIDEVRVYTSALSLDNIEDLYFPPDQIDVGNKIVGTKDTSIYEGSEVRAYITHTCADRFIWKPSTGVSNDTIANPILTPTQTTTYALTFITTGECNYTDSLRIVILDPNSIDCHDIMLPTAFTPNGDGLNDRYGISNPAILREEDFLSMEIYDRWGNIVFVTTEPLDKWDGTYKGTLVNPDVFLYKIRYVCRGEESTKTGSVTVLR